LENLKLVRKRIAAYAGESVDVRIHDDDVGVRPSV
jgi:hypothetical protein